MIENVCPNPGATAIREVQLEGLDGGIGDLQEYPRVLVLFRFHGQIVGQAQLPVRNGQVQAIDLQTHARKAAWPAWKILFTQKQDGIKPLPTATVVVCTRKQDRRSCSLFPRPIKVSRTGPPGHRGG